MPYVPRTVAPQAGAEASHADVSGWHMPLHHVTHCKGCSEEVALRIVQMLVDAGAEPGLARDKKGVTASVENKLAQPSASWRSGGCLQRQIMPQAAPKFRPASASQPLGPRWSAISGVFRHRSLRPREPLGVGGRPS